MAVWQDSRLSAFFLLHLTRFQTHNTISKIVMGSGYVGHRIVADSPISSPRHAEPKNSFFASHNLRVRIFPGIQLRHELQRGLSLAAVVSRLCPPLCLAYQPQDYMVDVCTGTNSDSFLCFGPCRYTRLVSCCRLCQRLAQGFTGCLPFAA